MKTRNTNNKKFKNTARIITVVSLLLVLTQVMLSVQSAHAASYERPPLCPGFKDGVCPFVVLKSSAVILSPVGMGNVKYEVENWYGLATVRRYQLERGIWKAMPYDGLQVCNWTGALPFGSWFNGGVSQCLFTTGLRVENRNETITVYYDPLLYSLSLK